jgi:hypothetical protein
MSKVDTSPLGELLVAFTHSDREELLAFGTKIGKLYTDQGFPIDMALDRLDYSKKAKLMVLTGALNWLVEHRRRSGATDAAIERQRKANRITLERYIATGEAGVY